MERTARSTDLFNEQHQPPQYGMLKTLTVLTFIGCALAYISILYNAASWGNYEKELAELQRMEQEVGDGMAHKVIENSIEVFQKSYEHRYALAATNLIFTTMCLIGAMRMRKLRKSGYAIYVIGELAPLAVSAGLIGFSFFGGVVMAVSAFFALLFVILYTTQRKYLIYS